MRGSPSGFQLTICVPVNSRSSRLTCKAQVVTKLLLRGRETSEDTDLDTKDTHASSCCWDECY